MLGASAKLHDTNPFKGRVSAYIAASAFVMITAVYHSIACEDPEFDVKTKTGPVTKQLQELANEANKDTGSSVKQTRRQATVTSPLTRATMRSKTDPNITFDGTRSKMGRPEGKTDAERHIEFFWDTINQKLGVHDFQPHPHIEIVPLLGMVSLLTTLEHIGSSAATTGNRFYDCAKIYIKDKPLGVKKDINDLGATLDRKSARFNKVYSTLPRTEQEKTKMLWECQEMIVNCSGSASRLLAVYQEFEQERSGTTQRVQKDKFDYATFEEDLNASTDSTIEQQWMKLLSGEADIHLHLLVDHFTFTHPAVRAWLLGTVASEECMLEFDDKSRLILPTDKFDTNQLNERFIFLEEHIIKYSRTFLEE